MKDNLIKRMMTKDGNERVSFFFDEYADSPRDLTDEPLNCEDWDRSYSIMGQKERENKSSSARALIEYLINTYGDHKKIIDFLVENGKHMTDGNSLRNNALLYDKSNRCWVLKEYAKWYGEKEYEWKTATDFNCSRKLLVDYVPDFLEILSDETINDIAHNFLTEKVKVMSYGFGYYGGLSFYCDFSTDSEGIAWIDKKEFMERNSLSEKEWAAKGCYDHVKWLIDELEAWSSGDCYCFVVEKAIKSKVHKTYINVEREDETFEEVEWELEDSCGGFYGDYDKQQEWMLETAGIKVEDLIEIKAA